MNILIADDHSIVRFGISFLLRKWREDVVLTDVETETEALELLRSRSFDLLILDIIMPDIDPELLIPATKIVQPELPILLYSTVEDPGHITRLVRLGANGYVSKSGESEELIKGIETVLTGAPYLSRLIQEQSTAPVPLFDQLSGRELSIAQLMIQGKGSKEICAITALQPSTISTYKARIFSKLGIDNVVELHRLAIDHKLSR